MGSQQLLLYVLGVIMILVVVAAGVFLFREYQVSSNKDAIIVDLQMIAADLDQYSMRPATMGGGDGSYDGYALPGKLASNDNGTYAVTILAAPPKGHGHAYGIRHDHSVGKGSNRGRLSIIGTSRSGFGTVILAVDDSTSFSTLIFSGQFQ